MNRSSIAATALCLALLLALFTWRLLEPDPHPRLASTEAMVGAEGAGPPSALVDATLRAARAARDLEHEDRLLDPPVLVDEYAGRASSVRAVASEDELARIVDGMMQGSIRLEQLAELALTLLARVDASPTTLASGLQAYRVIAEDGSGSLGSLLVSGSEPRSFTFTVSAPAPVDLRAIDPQSDARMQLSFRRHPDGGVECKSLFQVNLDSSPSVHQALSGGLGVVIGGAFEATREGTTGRPLMMRTDFDAAGEPSWSTDLGEPVGLTPAALLGTPARVGQALIEVADSRRPTAQRRRRRRVPYSQDKGGSWPARTYACSQA